MLQTGLTRDGTFLIEQGRVTRALKNFPWNESPLLMLETFAVEGPGGSLTNEDIDPLLVVS